MANIYRSLAELIRSLSFRHKGIWADYYQEAEQREKYISIKEKIIADWMAGLTNIHTAIDTGANDGRFSLLLMQKGIFTISADSDHFAINHLYLKARNEKNNLVHPLIIDFAAPSPAIGVNNNERSSLFERVKVDLVLSFAFIHHLAIGRNIPFKKIAQLYLNLGQMLLIEFVSKEDEKATYMIQQKKDIYTWYSEDNFLREFKVYYSIIKSQTISATRTLYLMAPHENKDD